MKKVLTQTEHMAVMAIIVLAFFPWVGVLNQSAIDISMSVLENITTVTSITGYGITVSVVFAILALVLALFSKGNALFPLISFVGIIVAFVYGMLETSGDYLSSMELAYYIALLISVMMLFKRFGLIKLKF